MMTITDTVSPGATFARGRTQPTGGHVADPRSALNRLRRIQWAARSTLALGVAVSIAANILHANPLMIAQIIAAWPPLALLVTVELVSRIPVRRGWLSATRIVATTGIAGIAAYVSYWHMVGVAARFGEVGAVPYLLPVSVDGLVVVASVSLVELAGRIRQAHAPAPLPEWVDDLPEAPVSPPAGNPLFPLPATKEEKWMLATSIRDTHPELSQEAVAGVLGVTSKTIRNWGGPERKW